MSPSSCSEQDLDLGETGLRHTAGMRWGKESGGGGGSRRLTCDVEVNPGVFVGGVCAAVRTSVSQPGPPHIYLFREPIVVTKTERRN